MAQEVNWITAEEAQEAFKKEKRSVVKLVGTSWCVHCKKLKKVFKKHAKLLNKNWHVIYSDNTDGKDDIRIYPTTYFWLKDGTNVSIEGVFSENILTEILKE